MVQDKTLLALKGIPPNILYAKATHENKKSPARFERIAQNIYNGELETVYTYLESGQLLDKLVQLGIPPSNIQGLDFTVQYQGSFKNEIDFPPSRLLYIFNVGLEPANNYEYADKVLRSAIQKQLNRRGQVIVSSEFVDNTTFRNRYPLSFELIEQQEQINNIKLK